MAKIPEGFHTITPQIAVSNGDKAIALYKEALGAKELRRFLLPGTNKIMHAALLIGDSKFFLHDKGVQKKEPKGIGSSFYLHVADVDAAHKRALAAGMSEMMAPADMFWGDRMSAVDDKFGHRWAFATHTRDVSPEEMMEAAKQQFSAAAETAKKRAGGKAAKKGDKKKDKGTNKSKKDKKGKKDKKK